MIGFVAKKLIKRSANKGVSKAMSMAQKAALKKAVKASALARKKGIIGKVKTAYTKKSLKKVNKLMAANKQKIRKLKMNTSTVYRVQNKKGQGPLANTRVALKIARSMPAGTKVGVKPIPVGKYNERRAAFIKKLLPQAKFERIDFTSKDKFGFANIKQANKYFSKEELNYYSLAGYDLKKVKNVKITGSTSNQLVFQEVKGLSTASKEAAALTKKYQKLMGL